MNRIQLRRLLGASLITLLVLSGCAGGGGGGGGDDRSSVNYLKSLSVTATWGAVDYELVTGFDKTVTSYEANVVDTVTSVIVTYEAFSSLSVVNVRSNHGAAEATGQNEFTITGLVPGSNTVTLTVTAENGAKRTYTVVVRCVEPPPSDVSTLNSLTVNGTTFAFPVSGTEYSAGEVSATASGVDVSYVKTDGTAAVAVTGQMGLTPGENFITVTVTAEDAIHTSTYTVTVLKRGIRINSPAAGTTVNSETFTVEGSYYGSSAPTEGITLTFGCASTVTVAAGDIVDPVDGVGYWEAVISSGDIDEDDNTLGTKSLYAEATWSSSDIGGHFRNINYAYTGAGALDGHTLSGQISTEEDIEDGYALVVYLLRSGTGALVDPVAMTTLDSYTFPQAYTLTGVPAGTYELYAILVDPGNFEYVDYYAAYEYDVTVGSADLMGLDMEMVPNPD